MASFLGTTEDYEKLQEENPKNEGSIGYDESNVIRLGYDDLGEISDETLLILRQTHNRHDSQTVYMQSIPEFYTETYNSDKQEIENLKLLAEVKKISRIYKKYDKYEAAVELREQYLDALVDKYGGESLFQMYYDCGLVTDWIPIKPVFSRNAPEHEYKLFLNHGEDPNTAELSDDELDRIRCIAKETSEKLGLSPDKIVDGGIETDYAYTKLMADDSIVKPMIGYRSTTNSNFGQTDYRDVQELQNVFTSWYRPDVVNESKPKPKREYFSQSPTRLRQKYALGGIDMESDMLTKMIDGTYEEKEEIYDPNEMLIDPETGRPMTRAELSSRKFIRLAKEAGWNDLKLMRTLKIGTSQEISILERKRRGRKKNRKKAEAFMNSINGTDDSYTEMPIASIDDLAGLLFPDGVTR